MEIKIKQEKKGYSANIPELRIHTQGETLDELWKNIKEIIQLCKQDPLFEEFFHNQKGINFHNQKEFSLTIS